jgi:hypothetical protein
MASVLQVATLQVGLDEILMARWLARFMVGSARIDSFEFFRELN